MQQHLTKVLLQLHTYKQFKFTAGCASGRREGTSKCPRLDPTAQSQGTAAMPTPYCGMQS